MLLTLFALLLSATPFSIAHAEVWNYNDCGSGGSWTTDTCWSGDNQPASGGDGFLSPGPITGGYTVTYDSNSFTDLWGLTVGYGSSGTVTLEITAPDASLNITYQFMVGMANDSGAGSGAVAQEGGAVRTFGLTLGGGYGDSGSYTLTGGSLFATYAEYIGGGGSGVPMTERQGQTTLLITPIRCISEATKARMAPITSGPGRSHRVINT